MTTITFKLFLLVGILTVAITSEAKEWRGIAPLHSTKSDVVRLLGVSEETNEIRSVYHLDREDV